MSTQSFSSHGTAQLLAGHANIVRINPSMPTNRFSLDGILEITSLKGLGSTEARKALPAVRDFFNEKVETFTPYHALTV